MWEWLNTAGLLSSPRDGDTVNIVLARLPTGDTHADHLYQLCGGNLPTGVTITNNRLTGNVSNSGYTQIEYVFTIRHYSPKYDQIDDITYSINVLPKSDLYTNQPYNITIVACTWVNELVLPSYFPPSTRAIVTSGVLPDGLYLTDDGYVRGYATQVDALTGFTCTVTFLTVDNIDVPRDININVAKNLNVAPVILNNAPLELIPHQYTHHYIQPNTWTFTTFNPNTPIALKLIGHDFLNRPLQYEVTGLPSSLTYDSTTGWITGSYDTTLRQIYELKFTARVRVKSASPISNEYKFVIQFVNLINDIIWNTESHLGTISNGSVCVMKVTATCDDEPVNYRLAKTSKLPSKLYISQETGEMVGTVMFQPHNKIRPKNNITSYSFEVEAYLKYFPYVISKKKFTFDILTKHNIPFESVYYPLHLQRSDRAILNTLLSDGSIIQDDWVYRPDDVNFGKARNIRVYAAYGLKASPPEKYADVVNAGGFYNKPITFGDLKTAVATDINGNVIYEVVYAPIIETNPNTQSVTFKVPVITSTATTTQINDSDVRINTTSVSVASHPTTITSRQTNSLLSMQSKLENGIGVIQSDDVIPLWMRTQQLDGSFVGFVHCWVICYTQPYESANVLQSIKSKWAYNITDIGAEINSIVVNKSATFNWNTTIVPNQWDYLPSDITDMTDYNKYDDIIPFPHTNIVGRE